MIFERRSSFRDGDHREERVRYVDIWIKIIQKLPLPSASVVLVMIRAIVERSQNC